MRKIPLYRVRRENGGIDITPVRPDSGEYETLYRLIADEGKTLFNGAEKIACIDTNDLSKWTETFVDEFQERLEALKARIAPIVEMWDGLSSIGKSTISRLLPKLSEAIEELRDKEDANVQS